VTTKPRAANGKADLDGIGERLREERAKAGISQRELARRLGFSPSLISQLESGISRPSVGTLYAIVTELGVSLDRVIRGDTGETGPVEDSKRSAAISPVVHPGERRTIDLASGVRWEQLTPGPGEGADFIEAIYDVGGASTPDRSLMRHEGWESGYVVSGTLGIQIGFEEYELQAGDSISFESTRPHRLFNKGATPVHAIWMMVGRGGGETN
jgi:transcriptional regulator with XRE-family HTH domain